MDKPNYYAVIPATVRYDDRLPANAKLLYGEITALAQKEGYCWASNEYFAGLLGVQRTTVSEWISLLAECHHVIVHIENKYDRKIYIPESVRSQGGFREKPKGVSGKAERGVSGKAEENNTSISITSNSEASASTPSLSELTTWEQFLEDTNVTAEYEGSDDSGISKLVYRRAGKVVPEKKLKDEFGKLNGNAPVTRYKARRDEFRYDFDTYLEKLRNSQNKADKIVALIWYRKGYRFDNYEQWRAQMDRDGVYAKKLLGYTGEQVNRAIDLCESEARKLNYEWGAATVWKKIAQVTV